MVFQLQTKYSITIIRENSNGKHIIANIIRYQDKESNNLDEVSVLGIDKNSFLEYDNFMEFCDRILSTGMINRI